jgi:hypothetical protein
MSYRPASVGRRAGQCKEPRRKIPNVQALLSELENTDKRVSQWLNIYTVSLDAHG